MGVCHEPIKVTSTTIPPRLAEAARSYTSQHQHWAVQHGARKAGDSRIGNAELTSPISSHKDYAEARVAAR